MHIVSIKDVPKVPREDAIFTGKEVTFQQLIPDGGDYTMNVVNFGMGIRNKFHIHGSDQILIITKGKGIVATEKEKQIVTVGDIVFFPAGEKHWHGATDDAEFSHIYILKADAGTTIVDD
jgi:quercetin dioxygenase-like cupin family protein